jgi:hypothetical protein
MKTSLLAMAVLLAPGFVRAEDAASNVSAQRVYAFDDELIQGDLARPDTEVLHVRRRGQRASLISVRTSYYAELLKSVEDL